MQTAAGTCNQLQISLWHRDSIHCVARRRSLSAPLGMLRCPTGVCKCMPRHSLLASDTCTAHVVTGQHNHQFRTSSKPWYIFTQAHRRACSSCKRMRKARLPRQDGRELGLIHAGAREHALPLHLGRRAHHRHGIHLPGLTLFKALATAAARHHCSQTHCHRPTPARMA